MENIVQGQWFRGSSTDLGDTIEQSLRFTHGSKLERNLQSGFGSFSSTATLSFWIKFTNRLSDSTSTHIWRADNVGASGADRSLQMTKEGKVKVTATGNTSPTASTAQLRDPNAWYHFMIIADSSEVKLHVNGENIFTNTSGWSSGTNAFGDTMKFDTLNEVANTIEYYLAEVNFLDGTKATVGTDFGRTNADGVWVPVAPNFTAAQYGTNGFRMVFDNKDNLGDDSAPTGASGHTTARDFTATGFGISTVRKWSNDLSLDANSTESSTHVFERAFDNNTGTVATNNEATGSFTFNPNPAISFSSSVKVRVNDSGGSPTATIGSTSVNLTANSLTTVVSGSGSFGAGGDALVVANTGSNPQLCQIEVDGVVLVNNTSNDIDYEDTPTNNHATLNPLLGRSATLNFEKANLRAQFGGGGSHSGMAGFGIPGSSGKYYWEVTLQEQKEGVVGIVSSDFDLEKGSNIFQDESAGWGWFVSEGTRENNNTEVSNSHTVPNVGDTIGFLLDTDAGECTIEINGEAQTANNGAKFTNIPTASTKRIYPYYRLGGASGDANLDWNFGQMPFVHEPSGFKHVATNSLGEPTIKNARDHFGVVTYTGTTGDTAVTGLDFQPDFVWIKRRDSTGSHILADSLRGVHIGVHSDSNATEFDDDSTVKAFDSPTNGFTVGNNSQAGALDNTFVAWCWKCNESFTPSVSGVTNASGKRNKTAGFSILTYTGNNSSGTITHGLDSAPEFIMFKRRTVQDNWVVYHASVGATKSLTLDLAGGEANSSFLSNTAPTGPSGSPASTITLGGVSGANGTGNFVAWCWHSVPGYSKIGSYKGNGDTSGDGSFIYTGFKVGWVMIKRTDSTDANWRIYDTTRNPHNENKNALRADLSNNETSDSNGVDLLSNGFKIIWGNAEVNTDNVQYVYMAFAENPFGGENTSPATAR